VRCALYARFSTDLQSASSIADQWAACAARARQEGLTVVARHGDEAVSGTVPVEQRPGGRALLADALAGRWEVLIVEALDRLSRDQVELERAVRRLEHRGVRIIGASDGYDSQAAGRKVIRAVRGIVAELYLDDLRAKTHRGLAGQIERGYSAGGRSYGYRTEPDVAPDGSVRGRRMVVDEAEADHVRWVFDRCGSDGWPARRIVHSLNERRVPSPRGSTWAVSGLYGSPARGIGVLNNELYIGRQVWNRTQWITDPETGKRTWRERPASEWRTAERPDLRIVSDEQWARVRARMGRSRLDGGTRGAGGPPRTLFAGILRCGLCGGPMAAISGRLYGCVAAKDRGETVCAGTRVPREDLDRRLLSVVHDEILSPAAILEAQQAIAAALVQHRRGAAAEEARARRRLADLEGEIGRVVDAIASVGASPALADRLRRAEAEAAQLRAATSSGRDAVADVEARARQMLTEYRSLGLRLQEAMTADRDRARELLGGLLGAVRVEPERDGEIWAEIAGEPASEVKQAAHGGLSLVSVAGARSGHQRRIRVR
jgi:DNA invertase Pin-like site-specific DNA recombinase